MAMDNHHPPASQEHDPTSTTHHLSTMNAVVQMAFNFLKCYSLCKLPPLWFLLSQHTSS